MNSSLYYYELGNITLENNYGDETTYNSIDNNLSSSSNVTKKSIYFQTIDFENLIVKGYLLSVIAAFGIVGNSLSVAVFLKTQRRMLSINVLLLGLQISDLIFVLTLSTGAISDISNYYGKSVGRRQNFWAIFHFIMYHLATFTKTGSHVFTVLVTIERYIAVCHPLKIAKFCTLSRAKTTSLIAVLFSMLLHVPSWPRYLICREPLNEYETVLIMCFGPTYNTQFDLIWVGFTFIVIYVIPFSILIVLNVLIFRKFREATVRRTSLQNANSSRKHEDAERSLIIILFAIVITFLFCNSFRVIWALGYVFSRVDISEILNPYTLLFDCINSAVNFIFYCMCGKKFRNDLKGILRDYFGYWSGIFSGGRHKGQMGNKSSASTSIFETNFSTKL